MEELTIYEQVQLRVILLDKIDQYQSIIDECSGDNESDMDLGIYYSIRIKELKTIYNKL